MDIRPLKDGRWQVFVHYPFDTSGRSTVCLFCGVFRWLWLAHLVGWWNHRSVARGRR